MRNNQIYESIVQELKSKSTFVGRSSYLEKTKEFFSIGNKQEQSSVCIFYGVGGVGKTSLRKSLSQKLFQDEPFTLQVHLDFNYDELRTLGGAMRYISNYLKKNCNIKFRAFENAYTIYWDKRHSLHQGTRPSSKRGRLLY